MKRSNEERITFWFAALVAAGILASTVLVPHPAAVVMDRVALLAILAVGAVARRWGVRGGVATAVAGFLVIGGLTYPRGFVPGLNAEPYVDLAIFLLVAVVAGAQTGQLKERERAAIEKETAMELVNKLASRMISSLTTPEIVDSVLSELGETLHAGFVVVLCVAEGGGLQPMRTQAASLLERSPHILGAAEYVFEHQIALGGPFTVPRGERPIDGFTVPGSLPLKGVAGSIAVPLVSAGGREGVLFAGTRRGRGAYSTRDAQLVTMVGGLLGLFFERQRLELVANRVVALQQADELKSALVSSVSHELRSPLAAVSATITGLLASESELGGGWVRDELQMAEQDLRTLDMRIGEILDISRLEASSWAPSLEWHDPADLCSAVVEGISEHERSRIKCVIPSGLPARFDFVQMIRALHHIVENALAYSPATSQVLIGGEGDAVRFTLWVEDRGPGIAESERDAVFDKFFRGSAAKDRPHGTGLGLAISAEIVRQHGGAITVESVEPHGARFVISLPVDRDQPARRM